MENSKGWRKQIKEEYGIKYTSEKDIHMLVGVNALLWTTRCSLTKPCKNGFPTEMYDSYVTRYFYRFVLERNLPFAILSDKYGLHFSDEKLPYYDLHPSLLSEEDKRKLGKNICHKAKDRAFEKIVFYNNSPLMSQPYFKLLYHSKMPIFFTTSLKWT